MFLQKYDDVVADDQRLADLDALDKKTLADVFEQTVEIKEKGQPEKPPQNVSRGVVNRAAHFSEEPSPDGGPDCQNGEAHPVTGHEDYANGEVNVGEVQITRM